jgi:diketogulonate reductase-like aldo/keto reductase
MPIQKETKLNTGANMPILGLGTFCTRIPEQKRR